MAACEEMALLRQAYLDGELDAAGSLAVERHLAGCPACAAEQREDEDLRAGLRAGLTYHRAPAGLRDTVLARLGAEAVPAPALPARPASPSRRALLRRAAPMAASLLVGVGVGALLRWPGGGEGSPGEAVLAAHLRALQPGHAIDVASTDQHTVKPWFDGRVDFAPPVRDLGERGFQLVGGRLDYLAGRGAVAVMVYRRRQHLIDLFAWPASDGDAAPAGSVRDGYNLRAWSDAGFRLWAVSDLNAGELDEFVGRWRAAG